MQIIPLRLHFEIKKSMYYLGRLPILEQHFGALPAFSNMLFKILVGNVSVSGCVFQNNSMRAKYPFDQSLFFYMIGVANFTDTVFMDNAIDTPITISTPAGPPSGYVQINNCTFDNDAQCMYILNVAVIVIQNSVFRIHKKAWPSPSVLIQLTKRILIAHSQFESYPKAKPLIEVQHYYAKIEKGVELKTLKSNFTNGEKCTESNSEDFMKNSTRLGFISISFGVSVEVQETKYGSSM